MLTNAIKLSIVELHKHAQEMARLEANNQFLRNTAISSWKKYLQDRARSGALAEAASQALNIDPGTHGLSHELSALARGDFSAVPPIVVLDDANIGGALGAYSSETKTIYLNKNWLNKAGKKEIVNILNEEYGHYLDCLLNATGTPGDEGQAFAAILAERNTSSELRRSGQAFHYHRPHESGYINVNGITLEVEFAAADFVSLVFDDGAIGTRGNNPQQNNSIKKFATLGIVRAIFKQTDTDGDGGFNLQGNDLSGTLTITTDTNNVYSLNADVVWNDKSNGIPQSFGILIDSSELATTISSSKGSFTLTSGNTANTSSNISLVAIGQSPNYLDNSNIEVGAFYWTALAHDIVNSGREEQGSISA